MEILGLAAFQGQRREKCTVRTCPDIAGVSEVRAVATIAGPIVSMRLTTQIILLTCG